MDTQEFPSSAANDQTSAMNILDASKVRYVLKTIFLFMAINVLEFQKSEPTTVLDDEMLQVTNRRILIYDRTFEIS